jgi:hypothetical protein
MNPNLLNRLRSVSEPKAIADIGGFAIFRRLIIEEVTQRAIKSILDTDPAIIQAQQVLKAKEAAAEAEVAKVLRQNQAIARAQAIKTIAEVREINVFLSRFGLTQDTLLASDDIQLLFNPELSDNISLTKIWIPNEKVGVLYIEVSVNGISQIYAITENGEVLKHE